MLDLVAGRLAVDGRPVELRPKTWEVLCTLAERPGELVSKSALLDRIWRDAVVTEGTLNKSIGELRGAAGDRDGSPAAPATAAGAGMPVARTAELSRLHAALARADTGARTIALVSGEAGAGKTMLVDRFLAEIGSAARGAATLVAHGQCPETSGPHEPYLPLLDALGRLARDRAHGSTVAAPASRRCWRCTTSPPATSPGRFRTCAKRPTRP